MSTTYERNNKYSLSSSWGGQDKGRCLHFTFSKVGKFETFTEKEAQQLLNHIAKSVLHIVLKEVD
jgi:hypothetical protein